MTNKQVPRLNLSMRSKAASEMLWPGYDPGAVTIGVAHIGPGAFFRAHLAAYIDDLLSGDSGWGISAISLKTAGLRDALADQDGLYVLAELDRKISYRVIGAIREILVASHGPQQVSDRLADPQLHLVSLTITEKGYCLDNTGRLDQDHADIVADLRPDAVPVSAIGWLVHGLRRRFDAGIAPFTVLSCDNLNNNGGKLRQALVDFASVGDRQFSQWIGDTVLVPSTMVDSITPATDDALRMRIAGACGVTDAWPIQRESFRQFVIEDRGDLRLSELSSVGVQLTGNVQGYEAAKLRLLNGAHSTLAYVGANKNIETVHDAMADKGLADLIETMMRQDIAPTLRPVDGLDLDRYIDDVLARFRNPAIRHLLSQIAWDGSKKLPIRLLDTIRDLIAGGRPTARLAIPIAAWMHFVRNRMRAGQPLVDPMADRLGEIVKSLTGQAEVDAPQFLGLAEIFDPAIAANPVFRKQVIDAYAAQV